MTYAFDERRVRLTDKVGAIALLLAFGIALFPLATEIWALWLSKRGVTEPGWVATWLWGICGIIAAAALYAWWFYRQRLGVLRVSDDFRTLYESLQQYMVDTSTSLFDEERTVRWVLSAALGEDVRVLAAAGVGDS